MKSFAKKLIILFCVMLINVLLAIPTVHFIKLSQRHVGHPLSGVLIFVVVLLSLFCLVFLIMHALIFKNTPPAFSPYQKYRGLLFSLVLLINSIYWLLALTLADSSCYQCGGFSPVIFFWINKAWIIH